MVNEMPRDVYGNDVLAKKDKNLVRGCRIEAARTTTTTAKRSGEKRDLREVVYNNFKVKGH